MVSLSWAAMMPVQVLQADRDASDGWKTVCLHFNKMQAPVICRVVSSTELLISPVSFHGYIRGGPLSKWLDESGATQVLGSARKRNLAMTLCPSSPCHWIPSERMAYGARKRKHEETATATGLGAASTTDGSSGVEIMATPAWLLVYTLLVNCETPRQRPEEGRKRRVRAFHVLTELLALACEAAADNKSQTEINTEHAVFSCTRIGHLQFDYKWRQA